MTSHRSETTAFVINYVVLLLLLAATMEAARHNLGQWNLTVAIFIAVLKAGCIVFIFMHLRSGAPLLKLVIMIGLLLLGIMLSLSLADYLTRVWDVADVTQTPADV